MSPVVEEDGIGEDSTSGGTLTGGKYSMTNSKHLLNTHLARVVKNPPANAGDLRDMGSIPGSGRSLEEGMATHFSILAWRIPWMEAPGGYSPKGHKESDMTEVTEDKHAWSD